MKRRKGLLKSVAESDPGSLLVVSECDDVSWIEERLVPEIIEAKTVCPAVVTGAGTGGAVTERVVSENIEANTAHEESIFTSLGKLIGSLFR